MSQTTIHTVDSAPDAARPLLEDSRRNYGMVPNLHGLLAESPQALAAYQQLSAIFGKSSLSAEEQNVVLLSVSVANACHYCVPAHTAIALGAKLDEAVVNAIRDREPIDDEGLQALRRFTEQLVDKRGAVDEDDTQAFLDAGFERRQLLDVILGVSLKTLSNHANHVFETPVDSAFDEHRWSS